ncbi:MAG: penicillin-binding protein 2 [Actinomycetaceae bacterium]|nr:penicillin-binding protein 2 [Actinomycetaceae bacterium]
MSGLRSAPRRGPLIIWVIMLVALLVIGVQLINVQIVKGPELAAQGRQLRTAESTLQPRRGDIVDATGAQLATSVQTYHIAVNQNKILKARVYDTDEEGRTVELGRGPAAAAQVLAPLLEMDEAELGGLLIGTSTYQYIKKNVSIDVWRQIRSHQIYGIEWEPSYERIYPNGTVAAGIIGSIGAEGDGNSGLELTQNDVLQGETGVLALEYAPGGQAIPGGKQVSKPAVNGKTVHTTLRLDLQHTVEEHLNAAVKKYNADWGVVAIEEISTGKILALADSGMQEISNKPQAVRAAQFAVEPGSVGKIVTVASALEHGKVTPETPIPVPYEYTTSDGESFIDSHRHPAYTRTVTGVLAESSNTGTVQIGQMVTDDERFNLFERFGFGKETGIGLPGESPGLLQPPQEWDGRQRYTTMFGQGYAITQLQQVAMVATIGNGGVYLPPTLIDGWTNADGTYEAAPIREPKQVLDKDVAQTMVTMMESTTAWEAGTGASFALEGHRTAAKTGTAELIENGAYSGTAANVVAIVPAENPTIAVSVLLYHPRSGSYAFQSAGPLFHDVATEAVRSLGIPASHEPAHLYPTEP